MITNTDQGQKSLALLLDEIDKDAKDAGIPDLFQLRKTQGLLVKALRRAMLSLEVTHCDAALAEMAAILEGKEASELPATSDRITAI